MTRRVEDAGREGSVHRLAGSALLSFAGSSFSALMGFVLTFVLARSLGPSGAGVVMQVIAVFMIAVSIARLGMDSAAVWYLPRLLSGRESEIRGAVLTIVGCSVLAGVATTALAMVIVPYLTEDEVSAVFRQIAWLLPVAAAFLVLLACTRGMGGIGAYVAIGGILVPALRPLLILAVVAAGGAVYASAVAWAAPFALGLVCAVAVVWAQVRRAERAVTDGAPARPARPVAREILGFALPRTVATGLEQAMVWVDLLIVGAIAGSAAAGIYGSASRFLAAALLIDTAMRVVVSPVFSRLLWNGETARLRELFTRVTTWLVLLSTPLNIFLVAFAPLVLSWLGPGFEEGSLALQILAAGMVVVLGAGSVHSLLLMSGRSGWVALNKAIALAINVIGNLIAVPRWGIEGAAVVWSISMAVDAGLATYQVKRFVGVSLDIRSVSYAYLVSVVTVGVPVTALVLVLGTGAASLAACLAVAVPVFLAWCYLDRRRLALTDVGDVGRTEEHLAG
ncbi:flippase [Mumia sp. zg.B21]|uniref:flippase n=1 Tax=Mumia sp. zg.B21 TaxID=2855447 RepID=UPI001C6F33D3|nr:flippase [Mumia sp. zg.B21]MBW9210761.1 flippase [Mumia sp. zg.B21]